MTDLKNYAAVLFDMDAGDAVLRQLAAILKSATSRQDMVFRYGGEEFSAILTNANLKVALQIGEGGFAL